SHLYGQNMQGQKGHTPGLPCLWTLGHEAAAPMAAEKTCCERYPGRFVAYGGQKLAHNTSGKLTKRSADFLPPYAAQHQLAVRISCRTCPACGLATRNGGLLRPCYASESRPQ